MTDTIALFDLRQQIAAATRILEAREIMNYSGHISCRIPGEDAILIQRQNDSRAGLMPDRLVTVGLDGRVLSEGKPPSELPIHLEILKARPDVNCVIHCHLTVAVEFTLMEAMPLVPLNSHAIRWRKGVPVHPDPSHIDTDEQGRTLAETLGQHHAALIRAHGMVLVAESVKALLCDMIHFQENAETELDIYRSGHRPVRLSPDEMTRIEEHEHRNHHVAKMWDYCIGKAVEQHIVPADWQLCRPAAE